MAGTEGSGIHVEAEQGDESGALARAALFCLAVSVLFILGGFYWLGRSGMLDTRSPDFVPVPHFFAFAALGLGLFFFVRAYLHGRRYRLFGTSVLEGNEAALGETFAGTLQIARSDALRAPITLHLRCDWRHVQADVGNPSSGSAATERLWEQSRQVPSAGATRGVPFRFVLPEDGLPSGRRPKPRTGVHPESPGDIVWTLRASSPRWGTDYVAEFEILVRPGRLIPERARSVTSEATPGASSDDIPMPLRAAAAIGEASAFLMGGNIPTAEELRVQVEADARPEPLHPFAGSPRPEQSGARLFRIASLIAGVVLGLIAGASLFRQATFGWRGADIQAVVVRAESHLVTLDLGADDPAHKVYVSGFHHWAPGQKVSALCEPAEDGRRRCRMQSGFDRWLDGLGVLAVALLAFALWNYLRHKSGLRLAKGD